MDGGSPGTGDDPRVVRAIAVDAEDVVMALEANRRGQDRTVLRVTPPFSGRMRARLHVVGDPEHRDGTDPGDGGQGSPERGRRDGSDPGDGNGPSPVVIPPERLVGERPPYPHPDDTEDAIRADPEVEYTPERHRQRHVAALAEWRDAVRAAILDTVTLFHGGRSHEVSVLVLG